MRQSMITLVIILALAALLRFVGIGSGIPFNIGVDEPEIMDRAVRMMKTGDFNPHFFDYPGLYFYAQLGVACLRFLVGATTGQWASLDQVHSADFYLWGRALTALLGTLTVVLVYLAGMRWGTRSAALAAGLMAVMPLHVRESHYVLTDVPATFFVALTLLLTLRAHERERAVDFAWAGAAAGLAAATKYPGALSLLLPMVAVWMTLGTKPSRLVGSLAAVGGFGAAFLAAAPYTLLDLPAFLNGYAHLAGYYSTTAPSEPAGVTYFKHLSRSMAWPAFLLVLTGLGLGAVRAIRGPGRVRWTITVVFPIVYFYFLSGQTLVYGRYLLPLLPFVCLLAAVGCVSGVSLLRRFDIPRAVRYGRHRGDHHRRRPPAGMAVAELHAQPHADEHRRAGARVDARQHSEGRVDRDRDAGARRLEDVQREERSPARHGLSGAARARGLRQRRRRVHRGVFAEVRRSAADAAQAP